MNTSYKIGLLLFLLITTVLVYYLSITKSTKVIVINSPVRSTSVSFNDTQYVPRSRKFIEPIHTRGYTYFSNIGYLHDGTTILPLYGKQTYRGSITWNYYVVSDTEHHVKIPLVIDNRDCLDYIGCKELYHNDTVFVEAFNKTFKVYMYKPQLYY